MKLKILIFGDYLFSKQDFLDSVARSHPHALFYDVVTVLSAHVLTAAANSDLCK